MHDGLSKSPPILIEICSKTLHINNGIIHLTSKRKIKSADKKNISPPPEFVFNDNRFDIVIRDRK